MTAKQRILALKFLEKQKKIPDYAKKLGVEVNLKEKTNVKDLYFAKLV